MIPFPFLNLVPYTAALKSLINYCLDIKITRPDKREILKRMWNIVNEENLDIDIDVNSSTLGSFHKSIIKRDVDNVKIFLQKRFDTIKKACIINAYLNERQKMKATLIFDLDEKSAEVIGKGRVTWRKNGKEKHFDKVSSYSFSDFQL